MLSSQSGMEQILGMNAVQFSGWKKPYFGEFEVEPTNGVVQARFTVDCDDYYVIVSRWHAYGPNAAFNIFVDETFVESYTLGGALTDIPVVVYLQAGNHWITYVQKKSKAEILTGYGYGGVWFFSITVFQCDTITDGGAIL